MPNIGEMPSNAHPSYARNNDHHPSASTGQTRGQAGRFRVSQIQELALQDPHGSLNSARPSPIIIINRRAPSVFPLTSQGLAYPVRSMLDHKNLRPAWEVGEVLQTVRSWGPTARIREASSPFMRGAFHGFHPSLLGLG